MPNTFAQHLRELKYNPLAAPTSRFGVMSLVYEHKGNRGWSSDLEYLVRNPTKSAPVPKDPSPEGDLSGREVKELEVKGTINILSGLIAALGGGTLGLRGGFDTASTVTFRYGEVTSVEVSEAELDDYIQSGTSDRGSVPGRYLGDHLYVANRVLRSRNFEVSAKDQYGRSIGLDLPVISKAVGAKVDTKWSDTSERTIAFTGDLDVTFAFQAFRILEKGGQMRIFPAQAGAGGLDNLFNLKVDIAGLDRMGADVASLEQLDREADADSLSSVEQAVISDDVVKFTAPEGGELE